MAWLTIQDALRLNGLVPKNTVRGVGLRGGRFIGVFDPETFVVNLDLECARFTRDVVIDGKATLDSPRTACSGRGSWWTVRAGRMVACGCGRWFSPDARNIRIGGRLGDRRVAAVVPAG